MFDYETLSCILDNTGVVADLLMFNSWSYGVP